MIIADIEPKEVFKGFKGRFVHMESFTIGFWEIEAGSELPLHSHVHEQTTEVIEGELEMTCNGVTKVYKQGMIVTIPSKVTHSGRAMTQCKLRDVFCPVREDYK